MRIWERIIFIPRMQPHLQQALPDLNLKWKEANIVPVFEKGGRKPPTNYRSVSLISFLGKILERVVRDALFAHARPAVSSHQHGVLAGRSCETHLAYLLNTACKSINQ